MQMMHSEARLCRYTFPRSSYLRRIVAYAILAIVIAPVIACEREERNDFALNKEGDLERSGFVYSQLPTNT
jgi:hypothetical protein